MSNGGRTFNSVHQSLTFSRRMVVVGGLQAAIGGVLFALKSITGSSRKRTIEKYENRKRDERNLYGHDVADRAREQQQQQATGA